MPASMVGPGVGEVRPFGCPVCGQSLGRPGPCPNRWCRRRDRGFSVVYAVGVHRGALRQAIARYKYRGERWWAEVFASMVGRYLAVNACWFEEFDLLTGVPSYTGPSARRPWDPVGEILVRLGPSLQPGWSVIPGAIIKRGETPGMQGRGWAERQLLAAGPIRRSLAVPDRRAVAGMRVLVLDDVLTEGSTMREVARVLRRAGALEVAGLVLARPEWTERHLDPNMTGPRLAGRGAH